MSSSSASLGWVTCCSSQLLESIAHFGSQTNRNQASATENVARRGDIAFHLAAVWRIVCTWHSRLSVPVCLLIYLARISFLCFQEAIFRSHVSLVYYLQHLWTEPTEAIFNAQILSEIPKHSYVLGEFVRISCPTMVHNVFKVGKYALIGALSYFFQLGRTCW